MRLPIVNRRETRFEIDKNVIVKQRKENNATALFEEYSTQK
jgi:hypothetical protein